VCHQCLDFAVEHADASFPWRDRHQPVIFGQRRHLIKGSPPCQPHQPESALGLLDRKKSGLRGCERERTSK
jgi:hypothetical protein